MFQKAPMVSLSALFHFVEALPIKRRHDGFLDGFLNVILR
jgi:hypothetical protein